MAPLRSVVRLDPGCRPERKEEVGVAPPPKVVQEWFGHSSIVMTFDVRGHLVPRGDDSKEPADAEQALLG